jgi:NDP-sugar pyrophosphorylase family protein
VAPPALRALVLAAGRGERLRPLTLALPKPLLPVAGRPLAAWTLDRLAELAVDGVALNLHHLGAAIRGALGDRYGRLPLIYSAERELLGTGGALPPLAAWLTAARAVLVVNGDSLCRWPLRRLIAAHHRSGAAATLLVARTVDPRGFGGGVAVEGGRIVAFRRGALAWQTARRRAVFAGAAVLRPELLARLPSGPSDIVAGLYEPLVAAGETIAAVETARPWFDLGTPARYLEGALAWGLDGLPERGTRLVAGAAVEPTARLRRVVVEAGARVGAAAHLSDSLLMPEATVGRGARLASVVVGPGATIGAGEFYARCLVTAGAGGELVCTPFDPPAAAAS